jgi:hypothetical protein
MIYYIECSKKKFGKVINCIGLQTVYFVCNCEKNVCITEIQSCRMDRIYVGAT